MFPIRAFLPAALEIRSITSAHELRFSRFADVWFFRQPPRWIAYAWQIARKEHARVACAWMAPHPWGRS